LAVTFLLVGTLGRGALLLIRSPRPELMRHAHHHLLPHCHCSPLAATACCEAPKGAPQQCRRLASRPCTWDEDASQVAISFARSPRPTFARPGVVPRTALGPRRSAGRRAQPAPVRAPLAQAGARRDRLAPGHTVEWLDLRQPRRDEQAPRLLAL